jgi:hypothetical protein
MSRSSRRASIKFTMASAVILSVAASGGAQDKSKGVYRIPYESGATVEVTNDHLKHKRGGAVGYAAAWRK